MLAIVLFAVAISVDGFLVGIAQGIRGIRVPLSTLIVINTVSAVIVFLSLSTGKYVACRLSPGAAKLIGSGILIAMGALMLKPLAQCGCKDTAVSGGVSRNPMIEGENEAVASGITKTLLMIPKFLAEPATADLDSSGTLTLDEGFLLGLALAIDALSVGFGAGMAGISSALTPVVAGVTQGIFVSLGLALGRRMRKTVPVEMLEKAPGGILILLGAMRLK